jgi:hypothetical protein
MFSKLRRSLKEWSMPFDGESSKIFAIVNCCEEVKRTFVIIGFLMNLIL